MPGAQPAMSPRVAVFGLGGTIAMAQTSNGGVIPSLSAEDRPHYSPSAQHSDPQPAVRRLTRPSLYEGSADGLGFIANAGCDQWGEQLRTTVKVVDTGGAGDAFLGALALDFPAVETW